MGKWRKGIICLTLMAVYSVLSVPISASNATVEAAGTAPLFSDIQGFRWKPKIGDRDLILNKVPYSGEALKTVAADKVDNYAQYATIDVTPKKKLIENSGLTEAQARAWKDQQYTEIAQFIDDVKAYNIQFFLHARVNEESEFTYDMIQTINAVKAKGLGGNIKGVMIGEHDNPSITKNYLQLALDVADTINNGTGDFLKNGKALTLHGKQYGSKFNGIQNLVANENFFSRISGKVSNFSFAFKFFDPEGGLVPASGDLSVASTWSKHFDNNLGLNELKTVLDNHKANYPNYAHVIFVGDSSDTLYSVEQQMSHPNTIITALENTFYNNGWKGFMFSQPFDYRDVAFPTEPKRGDWGAIKADGTFPSQPQLTLWQDWKTKMSN